MSSSSHRTSARVLRQGVSVLAVSGLLIGAARAQVDHGWLEDALQQTAQATVPWGTDARGTTTAPNSAPGDPPAEAAPEKPVSSALLRSDSPDREERDSHATVESIVQSVDALPYPWDDRIEVKSELVDPWEGRDTPWVNPEKHVLEDKFVQRAAPSTPWTNPQRHLFQNEPCRRHVPLPPWDEAEQSTAASPGAAASPAAAASSAAAASEAEPPVTEEDVWDGVDPGPGLKARSRADLAWDLERPWLRK